MIRATNDKAISDKHAINGFQRPKEAIAAEQFSGALDE